MAGRSFIRDVLIVVVAGLILAGILWAIGYLSDLDASLLVPLLVVVLAIAGLVGYTYATYRLNMGFLGLFSDLNERIVALEEAVGVGPGAEGSETSQDD